MKKLLVTPENPNGIEVEMTAEEIALKEQDDANSQAKLEQELAEITQKEADAKSGNQKFLDMGLTQAEATALTGYTPPVEE
nr:hypothetical protein [uncultured Mediterranean phage uvMED]